MDLQKETINAIKKLGVKETSYRLKDLKGKNVCQATVRNWIHGKTAMPMWAAQQLLDGLEPHMFGETYEQKEVITWEGKKLIIGFPCYKTTNPNTAFCLFALQDRHAGKVGLDVVTDTLIVRSRNIIATRFYNNPTAEWLLFIDDDMVVPIGKPEIQRNWGMKVGKPYEDFDIVSRLVSHKKPLVGGLYFGRNPKGIAQFGEAFQDKGNNQANRDAHRAPKDELRKTKWIATGMMLIHRSTLESIIKHCPEVVPTRHNGTYGFFDQLSTDQGEDMSFCARAAKAGIDCYVDMGCIGGHQGDMTFWQHNTFA